MGQWVQLGFHICGGHEANYVMLVYNYSILRLANMHKCVAHKFYLTLEFFWKKMGKIEF